MKLSIDNKKHVIFSLSKSKTLVENICKKLNISEGKMVCEHFADGETYIRFDESVRNKDIYIFQSTCPNVNDSLMELLIAIDALKRGSAKSITAILPYYGYARQDRKTKGREPITSKLIADMLTKAGANRVVLTDIHSDQTQGFFDIPVDSLRTYHIFLFRVIELLGKKDLVVVSPDYGGVKRARLIANTLELPLAIIDKRRPSHNVAESINVLGEVKNKNCLIVDDMIDTGGTVIAAAKLLQKEQAKKVCVMATHGLFNNDAEQKFMEAFDQKLIDFLFVSNSIPQYKFKAVKQFEVVDLASLYEEVVLCYANSLSVSAIYERHIEWIKKHV
ncbi:ribose-phosphate diphosphokinase [Mycoplasmoides genitalium]|uniref:Ribose-phosphate pyrophosphokinase n=2 Tax=Mycoplasmoides genitalium TaxID=2097 RepID=KPRS_MYCGE|nr:ribose-phosphate diphosphokinase [Mycoplasmoides genitalium]P47304.3 RecName: Full=Ribose-phosphate pyrophosphokinase; Short=RPPK; AltName: Full=5-phospho-D-ribosyl alpha-1-diphosphate synthase; AltName: Full=Phosphoribosyl diphosphate synthase; AltName: Full=Phosphoribosyl pyrophosphate synthase; Short=P-Rib-PP synthase; Short=PRPP synthase; Short=PRPPase [Mycoplasmoides genitalium G37]ABY79398.1 ribose-phosphate pyrophosphokinase [synthetic Mycoplasma genitalium JCVI-1.0]AAC71275.2 ribose-p